jgi:hypothetical protein
MKYAYVATLVFSIFLYAIPFEIGGNIMRVSMAFISIAFFIYVIRKVGLLVEQENRNKVTLLLVNTLAILHFALIFIIVVIDPSYLTIFLIGSVIASFVFFVVNNRMNRK